MAQHPIVSQEDWVIARKELLAREKAFTKLRDELSAERRRLPWVRVSTPYVFTTPAGNASLGDLFNGRSQLVVYHFMYGPEWQEGCKSCSFWADNFNGIGVHLAQRDVTLIAVSRAPLATLEAFKQRMGWRFPWVSSHDSSFNYDFHVSFDPSYIKQGKSVDYNYELRSFPAEEAPGVSVFYREGEEVFHTYSCYARGLDMLNVAYHYLDLVPKGRDEDALPYPMTWVRHHDRYES